MFFFNFSSTNESQYFGPLATTWKSSKPFIYFYYYNDYCSIIMTIAIVIFVFDTIIIIVIVSVFTIIQNTACPLQATSQVFALVPIGSQEHGRQGRMCYRDIYSFTCHGQVFHSTTYQ